MIARFKNTLTKLGGTNMKTIFTKIFIALMMSFLLPQSETLAQGGRRMERVHALKVAYITDHINLTSEQAEKFWPIYDDFEAELRKIRFDFRAKYKAQPQQQSPEEARNFIDDNLDYQEAILDLKKRYKTQFLKVISPQQLSNLLMAEREFKKMLLQQLQDRRRR